MKKDFTVCFTGHRKADDKNIESKIYDTVLNLIKNKKASIFLFGSKGKFNDICHKAVTRLKSEYGDIKRVYVRAEYPDINESYKNYLLKDYEETYFPNIVRKAGKLSYIKRNIEMIKSSDVCVFYYNENYIPKNNKAESGTKFAFEYAQNLNKKIINIFPIL